MFYRIRFDGYVGGILKRCHFDTAQSLSFWPIGATEEWVPRARSMGLKPAEAAALAVAEIALQRVKFGQISLHEGQYIASTACEVAFSKKARREIISRISFIAYSEMPQIHADS